MTEYNNLSETELQELINGAEQALKEKQSEKRKQVILQIKELANSIGVIVNITEDAEKKIKKNKKVAAKYRNPDNAEQTWSGRGMTPKWMQVLLAVGRDKSEFLI